MSFVLLNGAWSLLRQALNCIELGTILVIRSRWCLLGRTNVGVAIVRTSDIVNRHSIS